MIKFIGVMHILLGVGVLLKLFGGIYGSFVDYPVQIGIGLIYAVGLIVSSFLSIKMNRQGRKLFMIIMTLSLISAILGIFIMEFKLTYRSFLLLIYPLNSYRFIFDPLIPKNINFVYWVQMAISISIPALTLFYFSRPDIRQKFK